MTAGAQRGTGNSLYQSKLIGELVTAVKAHTEPNELIYCNVSYVGGMLSAFSGRATTNQMLRELEDRPLSDQIRPARLVVWIKEPKGFRHPTAEEAALQFHLRPLGETAIATLYYNPSAQGRRKVVRAILPWWAAFGMILGVVGIVTLDLKRR